MAANGPNQPLVPFEYDAGPLADDHVEVDVEYCGVCHSDVSMIDNEWGFSAYPFVGGHEIVGRIVAVGNSVKHLAIGQLVGVGWTCQSCMNCNCCVGGDHNLCRKCQGTILGHHGGFANKVRAQHIWAFPIPEGVRPEAAGPLFCGGITVFSPLMEFGISPVSKVGVVGIGGLGHMALRFLKAWGCEVTAFTSSAAKYEEARNFGAHKVVNSTDSKELNALAESLDLILVTANVSLDWNALINALAPKGRLHVVGAVLEPIPVPVFSLLGSQRSISGSPTGSPSTIAKMLEFCARHNIEPQVEEFAMSKINDALEHLKAGKARYRVVLKNDL
jgi:uncharacterized zinc-type alcohol dehydrogenase-like protein